MQRLRRRLRCSLRGVVVMYCERDDDSLPCACQRCLLDSREVACNQIA